MHRGFITIHRKISEWQWYSDANTFRLFIHLMLKANFENKRWLDIEVKRGQLVTSIGHLAQELHLTHKAIRVALNKLKRTSEVAIKGTNKYSLITLTQYDFYQSKDEVGANKGASSRANKGQAKGKPRATTKQLNNETMKQEDVELIPSKETNTKEKKERKKRKVKLIDDDFIAEVKKINPNKDVDAEIQKMKTWLLANPHREYSRAFFTSWISRANETPAKDPNAKVYVEHYGWMTEAEIAEIDKEQDEIESRLLEGGELDQDGNIINSKW